MSIVRDIVMNNASYIAGELSHTYSLNSCWQYYLSYWIKNHDDFNSLLSIKELLDLLGLPSLTVYHSLNELIEMDAPLPIIAELRTNVFYYVFISQWDAKYVYVSCGNSLEAIPREEFVQMYTQKSIILDIDSKPTASALRESLRADLVRWVINLLVSVGYLVGLFALVVYISRKSVLASIIGIVWTSVLLLSLLIVLRSRWKSLRRLCKGEEKMDCNVLLDSPKAQLWEGLSWADIGAIYALAALILCTQGEAGYMLLPFVFAIPFTGYSLYYQFIKAKVICKLCCLIQTFIVIGCILIIGSTVDLSNIDILNILCYWGLAILGASSVHYAFIYHHRPRQAINTYHARVYRQLKSRMDIFTSLMADSVRLKPPKEACMAVHSIPGLDLELTLVLNPTCPNCIRELRSLLPKIRSLRLNVYLLWLGTDARSLSVIDSFWRLYAESEDSLQQGLSIFARTYPESLEVYKQQGIKVSEQFLLSNALAVEWAESYGVHQTPLLIYGDRVLPPYYDIEDIIKLHQ